MRNRRLNPPRPFRRHWISWIVSACVCIAVVGCGGGRVAVSGTVTFKDKPIPRAEIRFVSTDNPDMDVFDGQSNDEGKYKLDTRGKSGIPKGDYKVTITWWTLKKDGSFLGEGEGMQELKESNKVNRHSVEFTQEVGDEPVINFEATKGKAAK